MKILGFFMMLPLLYMVIYVLVAYWFTRSNDTLTDEETKKMLDDYGVTIRIVSLEILLFLIGVFLLL